MVLVARGGEKWRVVIGFGRESGKHDFISHEKCRELQLSDVDDDDIFRN